MKLSDYQAIGVKFLASRRFALLADDPGLGKTAQTICAADEVGAWRVLVICPAVARINWNREFAIWSYVQVPRVVSKLNDEVVGSCIVSYDYVTENHGKLKGLEFDLIIVDESHFIKEIETQRTKAILGVGGLIRSTKRLWLLSGTPAPNHYGELWPMLFTFGATKLSYDQWVEKFCNSKPVRYGGKWKRKIIGSKKRMASELKEILAPVMLRRKKEEVLKELPPKSYEVVYVEGEDLLTVAKKYLPEEKRKELLAKAQEEEADLLSKIDEIDALIESLGNCVSTLRRLVGLQKVKSVAELVSLELESHHYSKIIIFGHHTDVIRALEKEFNDRGIKTVKIIGSTSVEKRQEAVDSFQKDPSVQIFLGNILAAGTAITLTASNEVLFIEESWVPGENVQASDRAHRRGQLNPVRVRFTAMADSFDEKIQYTNRRKAEELSEIY